MLLLSSNTSYNNTSYDTTINTNNTATTTTINHPTNTAIMQIQISGRAGSESSRPGRAILDLWVLNAIIYLMIVLYYIVMCVYIYIYIHIYIYIYIYTHIYVYAYMYECYMSLHYIRRYIIYYILL